MSDLARFEATLSLYGEEHAPFVTYRLNGSEVAELVAGCREAERLREAQGGLESLVPVWAEPVQAQALALVSAERARQEQRKADGRFQFTCADPSPDAMTEAEKLTVLVEEVGEVAQEVLTQDGRRLARDTEGTAEALLGEVIQVAAVAVAWAEALIARAALGGAAETPRQ